MNPTNINPLVSRELALIAKADGNTAHHVWSLVLHVNGTDYDVPLVMEQSVKRDYVKAFSDVFKIKIKMDSALYNTVIYPNRANLKATLTRKPVVIKTGNTKASAVYQLSQYDVQLYDMGTDQLTGANPFTSNKSMINTHSMADYEIQIMPKSIRRLKGTTIATVPRNCKAIDAISTLLMHGSTDASDVDDEVISGVDVADGYSETVLNQILIPHNTPLIRLPEVINRNTSGVYNTGFGYYLQNGKWYIYSPFDIERIDRGQYSKSLTIISVPPYQVPGIEKTYRDTGTQVIVIANGDTKVLDSSERLMANDGASARYADASRMLDQQSSYESGKVETHPDQYINEYSVYDREDGMNKASTASSVSANPKHINSRMAELKGMYIGTIWDNSAPEKLYPGMPVKYVYFNNGMPVELRGVLLGSDSKDNIANKSVASPIFTTTTYLKLFVERKAQ